MPLEGSAQQGNDSARLYKGPREARERPPRTCAVSAGPWCRALACGTEALGGSRGAGCSSGLGRWLWMEPLDRPVHPPMFGQETESSRTWLG